MLKRYFVIVFLFLLARAFSQCPQVYDYLGNLSSKPYWISCTGNNYVLNFQSNSSWGSYSINWGDATPVFNAPNYTANSIISHTYSATVDTFIVNLSIPGLGCNMFGVVVMEKPVNASIQIPIGGVTQACAPATLQFINSSTDVSKTTKFTWNFGDGSPLGIYSHTNAGQTISHTYSVGTVNCQTQVTLQAENYCSFGNPTVANFNPIQIYDKDQANITPSSLVKCWPSNTFTFTNTTIRNCLAQGNTFQREEWWNFGNYWGMGHDSILNWKPWPPTSPINISYPSVGTYTVMLRDSNLCGVSQQVISITLMNPPTAGLLTPPAPLCQSTSVTFTNNSTPGYFYQWNFGAGGGFVPGGVGTQSFTYPLPGTYTVQVVAFFPGGGGCSDTAKSVINIAPSPTANFSYTPSYGCNSLSGVTFTNSSIGAISYNWNFGNGNTSTVSIPSAQNYTAIGTYSISLTITGANTCVNTKTASISVYQSPTALFSPTITCVNSVTTFTDQSISVPTNTIINWNWNFGDGSPNSMSQNAMHSYTATGTFTVKLVVSSTFCKDSISKTITINPTPSATFVTVPPFGCTPLTVNFVNGSTGAVGYYWDLGVVPNATTSATNPSFQYVNSTSVTINPTITLVAINSFGCTDSIKKSISIYPKPSASFTANTAPGCTPLAITFTNNTIGATTYTWNFGDGNNSSLINPVHTYTNGSLVIQTFTAQLIVTNLNGCIDTASQVITIYPKPLYSFTMNPSSGCPPLLVNFPPVLGAVSYNWNFGDGGTSTLPNPTHTFTNISTSNVTYTVTLIASNAFGCSDTAYGTPVVYAKPNANFNYSPSSACSPVLVTYTNTSILNTVDNWSFGDGNFSTLSNPANTYTASSPSTITNFTTQLQIISSDGCKDSIQKVVSILPTPIANFNVDTPACSNKILTFTNTSVGGTSYNWDFGNSNISTSQHPTQQYINSGTAIVWVNIQLITTNTNGCKDTLVVPISIKPKPNFNIIASPDSGCAILSVNFPSIPLVTSYNWNFGDGGTATASNPNHSFVNLTSSNKVYTVQLIASDGYGCKDTSNKIITVFPKPIALFQASPTTVFIPDQSVNFTNQSNSNISNYWQFGDGFTSTEINPKHFYNTPGEFQTTLIVTNSKGCKDTFNLTTKIIVLEESSFQIPNAFTPNLAGTNGGGFTGKELNNDVFFPVIKGVDKERYSFSIFSRWGELLFETKDTHIGWDGYYKGKLCTQDVYVWKLNAITLDGKVLNKTGDVLLLK